MAGYSSAGQGAVEFVNKKLKQRKVLLFTKKHSPEGKMVHRLLEEYNMDGTIFETCEIDARQDVGQIENYFHLLCLTDTRSVPQLFVNNRYIGGDREISRMHDNGELRRLLSISGALS